MEKGLSEEVLLNSMAMAEGLIKCISHKAILLASAVVRSGSPVYREIIPAGSNPCK